MPQWVENCKDKLLAKDDFYPKRKDRESLAYAICTKQYKKRQKAEDEMTTEHCICIECGNQTTKSESLCPETSCPDCGQRMVAKERKSIPMRITKATMRDGRMFWQGAVSDTEWDDEDEKMSLALFIDFKSRLDKDTPPFLSLSHYGRMEDGSGERGIVENIWTQGQVFKAEGYFNDDPLSAKCFEVARDELKRTRAGEEISDPVRFSIGFYPRQVAKSGDRTVYLKGDLDHIALTRVPVNPRTGFTELEVKSMATRKEDALSIVGEELADEIEELDEKHRADKADVDDLVIKGEIDSPATEEQYLILRANLGDEEFKEKAWTSAYKRSLPNSAYAWVEKGSGCEKSDGKTPQKCRHLPYKSKEGGVDCAHVRAALQAIGGARTGKKMKGVPASAKSKLQRALKGCQKGKAEILETELSEYEQGRIEGFNDALDMMVAEEEAPQEVKLKETKSEEVIPMSDIDVDAIKVEDTPDEPETKSDDVEQVHPIDQYADLLKKALYDEEASRSDKVDGVQSILQSLAAFSQKTINEIMPPGPEDIAKSLLAGVTEAMQPLSDRLAVIEESVKPVRPDAPGSKALKPEFYIDPTSTFLAAQQEGPSEKSVIKGLVRQSVGLDDGQL